MGCRMTGLNAGSANTELTSRELTTAGALDAVVSARSLEVDPELSPAPDPEAWRTEVAARLARYRTRRKPRAPRYPSLLLPFDSSSRSASPNPPPPVAPSPVDHNFFTTQTESPQESSRDFAELPPPPPYEPEYSAKIIEFPRSAAIPSVHASLLADPIFDRPRIVEAPEIIPPPPALGGILIEPVQLPPEIRLGPAPLVRSASIPRRLLAAGLDGLIVAAAVSAFAAIFVRFNPARTSLPLLAAGAALILVLFWVLYQFVFIVYTASTPGLRAARLILTQFDGRPAPRRLRRWRVLASFLSALSAGLGYLWSFLDHDSLCWHDRITRTYIASS
jgi:uncharacterized RDD family membrane protein YckC